MLAWLIHPPFLLATLQLGQVKTIFIQPANESQSSKSVQMGAWAGLIKSALKHIFRLWTDVYFVESCARWRLQATLLEVIALAALLAEPSQILFGSSTVQTCISGGDGWRGHCLLAHAGLLGTAPALLGAPKHVSCPLSVKMNQVGLYGGNKRALVCSGSSCLTRSGEP